MKPLPCPHQSRCARQARLSSKCNREKSIGGGAPIEAFARAMVDEINDSYDLRIGNREEVEALGKKETEDIIRILIGSSLPRFMRFGEIDGRSKRFLKVSEICELGSVIKRKTLNG